MQRKFSDRFTIGLPEDQMTTYVQGATGFAPQGKTVKQARNRLIVPGVLSSTGSVASQHYYMVCSVGGWSLFQAAILSYTETQSDHYFHLFPVLPLP